MQKIQNKFDSALRHHKAGRLQKAKLLYREALKIDPNYCDAIHMLGMLSHQMGDNVSAVRLLNTALTKSKGGAELYTNLGNALQASGQLADAISSFKKALEINPDFILAQNNLGNALSLAGNNEEAINCLKKTIQQNPDHAPAYYNLGNALYSRGEQESAIKNFRKALAIDPGFSDANNNLASLLSDTGHEEEAKELFERALQFDKKNAMAKHMLAAYNGITTSIAPADYVKGLFDGAANIFDKQLVEKLEYKAPELLYNSVNSLTDHHNKDLDVMDLGCGTGLCAPHFHTMAKTLKGIDLSPMMLQKAEALKLYDELIIGDITDVLKNLKEKYDLILSADVFIYLGELNKVFRAISRSLKPGGLLAFSLEAEESADDYKLHTTGRYTHSRDYINRLAKENELKELYFEEATLRKDKKAPVKGYIVIFGA
jgi:predicted TPR repeat methyltransferase